jgi:hypothetical protein
VGGFAACGITLARTPLSWGLNDYGLVGQANEDP